MDLSGHFRVIWRRRWRVLAASLAVAAVVGGWSTTRPEVYEASTVLNVTSGRATAGESVIKDDTVFLSSTYAELVETRPVVTDAALRSGLELSAVSAGRRLSATASSDVGFLTVSSTGPSPDEAAALADAAGAALVEAVGRQQDQNLREALAPVEAEILELELQLAGLEPGSPEGAPLQDRYQALVNSATDRRLQPVDRLTVVSPARSEASPVSPTPVRDAFLALLAALVINGELAVVLAALSDRFSAEDEELEASEVTGLPVLARVPASGEEAMMEAFRTLRTNLMFMDAVDEHMRTIAVVGGETGIGKSFTSINLARSAATIEIPVVLVDADLRRPSVHRYLNLAATPGLAEVLAGHCDLTTALDRVPGDPGLQVLTGGSPAADPSRLVGSQQLGKLLDDLDWAGLVVVDTPASGPFADALAIASRCDATLIVVDVAASKRRAVRSTVQQLHQVGARPIGVVLNRTDPLPRSSYHYGKKHPSPRSGLSVSRR